MAKKIKLSYLEMFKQEANELLSNIDNKILQTADETNAAEIVKDIKRNLHTIKGSASYVNATVVHDWCHHLENYFKSYVNLDKKVEEDLTDKLLVYFDWLKHLIDLAFTTEKEPSDFLDLCKLLSENREIRPPQTLFSLVEDKSPKTQDDISISKNASNVLIQQGSTHRVLVSKLDHLLNLSGELYVKSRGPRGWQNKIQSFIGKYKQANSNHFFDEKTRDWFITETMQLEKDFEEYFTQLQFSSTSIKEQVSSLRMVPINDLFENFPRIVHDTTQKLGKNAIINCKGGEYTIDNSVIEAVKIPFEHLIRNAIDHGIESVEDRIKKKKTPEGHLRVKAIPIGEQILIELSDDGAGINLEKIKERVVQLKKLSKEKVDKLSEQELMDFIFLPGFSTRDEVSSTSGRGIGMDVVKNQIEKNGGTIRIKSVLNEGTTFSINLPLNLAVTHGLVVNTGPNTYIFPTTFVEEYAALSLEELQIVGGKRVFNHQGTILGAHFLREVMNLPDVELNNSKKRFPVIILQGASEKIAVVAEYFNGESEIVVRSLDSRLKHIEGIMGITILSDGQIAQVIDIPDFISMVQLKHELNLSVSDETEGEVKTGSRILVVEDSLTIRKMEKDLLEEEGFRVLVATDGIEGLRIAKMESVDLILTDIDMPRMNGIEMTMELKKNPQTQNIPIIIVSYKDRKEDKARGLEAGADHYIGKSEFNTDDFFKVIKGLI